MSLIRLGAVLALSATVLAASGVARVEVGQTPTAASASNVACQEDQACWDPDTMGNDRTFDAVHAQPGVWLVCIGSGADRRCAT